MGFDFMEGWEAAKAKVAREIEENKLISGWKGSGTPVHPGTSGGFVRYYDPETGEPGPSALEILSTSPEARIQQQQRAMRFKGMGFPGTDWSGPQESFFTDGKPQAIPPGTRITPEQMGFAKWDPEVTGFETPPPGWSPVTGTVDPIEAAKAFSDGKPGHVVIEDVYRILPKIITPGVSKQWNEEYRKSFSLLPKSAKKLLMDLEGEERTRVTESERLKIIREHSDLLTQGQRQVLEMGKSYTGMEAGGIVSQMAFEPDLRGLSRKDKEGRRRRWEKQKIRTFEGFPGEWIDRMTTAEDKEKKSFYSELANYYLNALAPHPVRESEFFEGRRGTAGEEPTKWITRGQLVEPVVPEWAERGAAKPAWFDPTNTGRLLGEISFDEDLIGRVLQAPNQIQNFIKKHLMYIPAVHKRRYSQVPWRQGEFGRFGAAEWGGRPSIIPTDIEEIFGEGAGAPTMGARESGGIMLFPSAQLSAAEIIGTLASPEARSKKAVEWLNALRHIPKTPGIRMTPSEVAAGVKVERPWMIADALDYLGPNVWELGHGFIFGLAGALQKYVNPLSRQNTWSSDKSIRQGLDEFSEGAGNFTKGLMNSFYRSVPGVDAENMFRYEPLIMFLNLSLARAPITSRLKTRAADYTASANAKYSAIASRVSDVTALSAGRFAGRGGRKLSPLEIREMMANIKMEARAVNKSAADDLRRAGFMNNSIDALTAVTAPLSILGGYEIASIIVRRFTGIKGREFANYLWNAPFTRAAAGKALAGFYFIEREAMASGRKGLIEVQELANAIDELKPAQIEAKLWMTPAQIEAKLAKGGKLTEAERAVLEEAKDGKLTELGTAVLEEAGFGAEAAGLSVHGVFGKTGYMPSKAGTTFNEMAWMEHEPIFFNDPAKNLASLNKETGMWELTEVGKRELQIGPGHNQAAVPIKVQQLRSEVASKIAVMNIWGVDLVRKSVRHSEDMIKMKLVHSPEQIRELFWAQVYDPAAMKNITMSELAERQKLGETRTGGQGVSGPLLDNSLRKAGIPIEARLVRIGEAIPKEIISKHKALIESLPKGSKERSLAESGLKEMVNRNEQGLGGFGMTDDFFKSATTGLGRMSSMIETHKIFNNAAKDRTIAKAYQPNKGWMQMPNDSLYHTNYKTWSMKKLRREAERLGVPKKAISKSGMGKTELIKMMDSYTPKKYGDLGGMWVQSDVWYHIINGEKFIQDLGGWYPKMLSSWKSAHTGWSPTTVVRNLLTNIMFFAPMAGISMMNPGNWKYYKQAIKDAFSNKPSRHWKDAFEDQVFDSEFYQAELGIKNSDFVPMKAVWDTPLDGVKEFFGLVDRVHHGAGPMGWIKKRWHGALDVGKLPGLFYSKVGDNIFKQAYHHKFKDRVGRVKAAEGALEKFIDYKNVPGFANLSRLPFAPFTKMTSKGPVVGMTLREMFKPTGQKTPIGEMPTGRLPTTGLLDRPLDLKTPFKLVHFLAAQPFISYTIRAIPLAYEWMARSPVQAQMYMAMHDAMTYHSFANAGISDEGVAELYGMVRGMNRWERMRYAPVASLSIMSFVEGEGTQYVPGLVEDEETGEEFPSAEGAVMERRREFFDFNFLNPWSYAMPSSDPIKGSSLLEYAHERGFLNHFYFNSIARAYEKVRLGKEGEGLKDLWNEIATSHLAPVMVSPTDLASVFGGSDRTIQQNEYNGTRYKGGRFWEDVVEIIHGRLERDEYARTLTQKVGDLIAFKTKGYTKTILVIHRSEEFLRDVTDLKNHYNKQLGISEEFLGLAEQEHTNDEALKSAAEDERDKLGAYRNSQVVTTARKWAANLSRTIRLMPETDAKSDIHYAVLKFLRASEGDAYDKLEELTKIIGRWSTAQRDIIKSTRMMRTSREPLTEEQREYMSDKAARERQAEWDKELIVPLKPMGE